MKEQNSIYIKYARLFHIKLKVRIFIYLMLSLFELMALYLPCYPWKQDMIKDLFRTKMLEFTRTIQVW